LQRCISIGEAVLGSKAQSFAASYLDQEKGQAEALTVWQGKQQLDHRFALRF